MKRTSPNGLCPWIKMPDGKLLAETLDVCLYLAGLASPAGRPLATTDEAQRKLFDIANTPPLMHWPDNSNPENCAWLLNMFKWRDAAPKVPAYISRVMPALRQLDAQLATTFFAGEDAPGVGDIGLFATVDMIVTIYPQLFGDDTELPRLKAWYAAMAALPGIAEYLSARPQLGARKQGNPGSLMYDGQSASSGSYCVSS